jgi:hypothetical protein
VTIGAVVSALVIIFVFLFLYGVVRSVKKGPALRSILMEKQDFYSLTKFQIVSWTIVFLFSLLWVYLVRIQGNVLTNIQQLPSNTLALMGINVTSAIGSSAIPLPDVDEKDKRWDKWKNNFWSILVSDDPQRIDLTRVQFFIWTLVSIGLYLVILFTLMFGLYLPGSPVPNLSKLSIPDVDPSLVTLMGLSHGAYVGTKYIQRRQLSAAPPATPPAAETEA